MSQIGYVRSGADLTAGTASGVTQTTALAGTNSNIPVSCSVFQVSVSNASNNAIALPANPLSNQKITVRNDGSSFISVFPRLGGTINALSPNLPFLVGTGGCVDFVSTGSLSWLVTSTNGVVPIVPVSTTFTVDARHSGCILNVAQTSAYTITLPSPSAGFNIRARITTSAAFAVALTSTGANMRGNLAIEVNTAANAVACNGVTTVNFAASQVVGAFIQLDSDGTNYLVEGASAIAAGFTTA